MHIRTGAHFPTALVPKGNFFCTNLQNFFLFTASRIIEMGILLFSSSRHICAMQPTFYLELLIELSYLIVGKQTKLSKAIEITSLLILRPRLYGTDSFREEIKKLSILFCTKAILLNSFETWHFSKEIIYSWDNFDLHAFLRKNPKHTSPS